MRISVLDTTPVPSGATATAAVKNTIDLARHAEALGLTRYWLAEHHNAGALACPAPEIMIAAVAAATTTIRVGSGGVMLPNHAPLKVAENFRVLGALHPGRIDLGIGRAAGTDPKTALALRQSKELLGAEQFPAQLDELLQFLGYEPDPHQRFGPIKATPTGVPPPPLFILGSGSDSARLAAERGLGYAYAHHIGPDGYAEAMQLYRASFKAPGSPKGPGSPGALEAPYAILAVAAACAKSTEHAADSNAPPRSAGSASARASAISVRLRSKKPAPTRSTPTKKSSARRARAGRSSPSRRAWPMRSGRWP